MYGGLDKNNKQLKKSKLLDKKHAKNAKDANGSKKVSKDNPEIAENQHRIPKGAGFKNTFYIFVMGLVLGLVVMVFAFLELSHKDEQPFSVADNPDQDPSAKPSSLIHYLDSQSTQENLLGGAGNYVINSSEFEGVSFGGHKLGEGDYILKNGKLYAIGKDGKLHLVKTPPKEGMVAYEDGQKMMYHNGHWAPVADSDMQAGQYVVHNGKLYKVGKDGQLIPYNGKLHDGDIVWKHGKKYMYENGKLVPYSDSGLDTTPLTGPQAGDLVMKDGKLYKMGDDGKLHLFHGTPKEGQIIWKNGKAYIVGKDGKLKPLENGYQRVINGKPYVYENGKWVPLAAKGLKPGDLIEKDGKYYQVGPDGKLYPYNEPLKRGQIVWKNGKPYLVGKDGNLTALKDGQTFTGADGKKYRYVNGHLEEVANDDNSNAQSSNNGGLNFSSTSDNEKALLKAYSSEILAANTNTAVIPSDKTGQVINGQMGSINGTPTANSAALNSQISAYSSEYNQANAQAEKSAFLNGDHNAAKPLPLDEIKPATPYTVTAGSIIPATLVSGIDSDLPGPIKATVSQNVYDTVTGNYLLIPQGSVLNGVYDSSVSYGQTRVMMVWSSITFPDGNTVNLGGMPGADLQGYMGSTDLVDNHYMKVFGSALLFSLFGAGSQLTQPSNSSGQGPTTSQIVYAAVGQQLTQTAQAYLQKDLNIQPTLKIRPGNNFQVFVTRNLSFKGAYQFANQTPSNAVLSN